MLFGKKADCYANIELQSFYTDGDRIKGQFVIETKQEFSLGSIQASLACREYGCVIESSPVWNDFANQWNYQQLLHTERRTYWKTTQTIYPPQIVEESLPGHGVFKLNQGVHSYPFDIALPPNLGLYPPSIEIQLPSHIGVFWWLEFDVNRPHNSSHDYNCRYRLTVCPSMYPLDLSSTVTKETTCAIKTYLEGHRRGWKSLFDSEHKCETEVTLALTTPEAGIPQNKSPGIDFPLRLEISASSPDLILLARFDLIVHVIQISRAEGRFQKQNTEKVLHSHCFEPWLDITTKPLSVLRQANIGELKLVGFAPTWDSELTSVSYELEACLYFVPANKTDASPRSASVRTNIRILCPTIDHDNHHSDHSSHTIDAPVWMPPEIAGSRPSAPEYSSQDREDISRAEIVPSCSAPPPYHT